MTDAEAERPASDPRASDPPASDPPEERDPTFREAFGSLARSAGIGQVAPGEIPTASSLLSAVGGARGLIESILPGLTFLVLFSFTRNLPVSVIVPVVVAIGFVVARAISRTPVTQALIGVLGVAISAGLALFTGRAEDNFVVGIITNSVSLVVLLTSLIARYPLIGLLVGALANEGLAWRRDVAKMRIMTIATLMWSGLFAIRLAAQVPLYLAGQVEWLAGVKLVLGVPFYAVLLWVTWLLVRTVYPPKPVTADPTG